MVTWSLVKLSVGSLGATSLGKRRRMLADRELTDPTKTENKETSEYQLKFKFKKTVWNKGMVVDFEDNEDQGSIAPIYMKLKNVVLRGEDDAFLTSVLYAIEYLTLIIIAYMLYKRKPLVWHIIDTVVVFCFMIYLNSEVPFNLEALFLFFNPARWEKDFGFSLPTVIADNVLPVLGQEAPEGFDDREKTTLWIANMDLCLIVLTIMGMFYYLCKCVANKHLNKETQKFETKNAGSLAKRMINIYEDMHGDGWMQIFNSFYMKVAVFSFLQFYNLSFAGPAQIISSIMAILCTGLCLWYPIYIGRLIKKGNLKDKEYIKAYGGIWDEYKEDKFHTAAFEMVVCIKKLFFALALVFLQGMPALQVTVITVVSIIYYVLVLLWEPYKLKYANIFFAKAEFMFVIGLTLLLLIAYKKDALEVDVHKTIGWGITFTFAFGWLRMIQLFFVRKLNQLSKKVVPKDGEKESAKKEGAKGIDAIPAFESYVKNNNRTNRAGGYSRSRLGGKVVVNDDQSDLMVDSISGDSSDGMSNVEESELSNDSLDIPDQSEVSISKISMSQSVQPEVKDIDSESEESGSDLNDDVSFDSNSEKSFDEGELSEGSEESSHSSNQGALIGVQDHGAEDRNELKGGLVSKIGGTIRVSSSHSKKRSQKQTGALASKYTRSRK